MLRAVILALIAGYVDTVGYLHFNAFAGLMTGNTIFMGIELATAKYDMAVFHGIIILAFLFGVIVARIRNHTGKHSWLAMSVAGGLLVVCSFTEDSVAAVLLSLAMGMQNSAANRFNGVALNTVFITGNLQKLGEELVTWLWPRKDGAARQGAAPFDGREDFGALRCEITLQGPHDDPAARALGYGGDRGFGENGTRCGHSGDRAGHAPGPDRRGGCDLCHRQLRGWPADRGMGEGDHGRCGG